MIGNLKDVLTVFDGQISTGPDFRIRTSSLLTLSRMVLRKSQVPDQLIFMDEALFLFRALQSHVNVRNIYVYHIKDLQLKQNAVQTLIGADQGLQILLEAQLKCTGKLPVIENGRCMLIPQCC